MEKSWLTEMRYQLNPNAIEFVPVSPTQMMLQDDAIIAAAPLVGPAEDGFTTEISQWPGNLRFTNDPRDVDDYFMRDNFSTLRNRSKDVNFSSICAERGNTTINSLNSTLKSDSCVQEDIQFDELNSVQSLEEQLVSSVVLGKENPFVLNKFGFNNSDNLQAKNIFGMSIPMKTSVMELKGFSESPDQNEATADIVESPKLKSPIGDPLENLTSEEERNSLSEFDSETRSDEGILEDNDGYITELRKSPPIDLSFKPIQAFSDINPFGALQTPSATTPIEQNYIARLINLEGSTLEFKTPKKDMLLEKQVNTSHDYLQKTPSSFIALRKTPEKDETVPFDQLESPTEIPQFVPPPNSTELPQSTESEFLEGVESLFDQEICISYENKRDVPAEQTNTNELVESDIGDTVESELPVATPEIVESKYLSESLNTTAEIKEIESKIVQDEIECEKLNKEDQEPNLVVSQPISNTEPCITVFVEAENDVAASLERPILNSDMMLDIKSVEQTILNEDSSENDARVIQKSESQNAESESNNVLDEGMVIDHACETKISPDDTKSLDESFEVINKEDLCTDKHSKTQEENIMLNQEGPLPPSKQTNPLLMDETSPSENITLTEIVEKEQLVQLNTEAQAALLNAIDDFTFTMEDNTKPNQHIDLNISPSELLFTDESKATKTVSNQTLPPADEPKEIKVEFCVNGIEETLVTEKIVSVENLTEHSHGVQNESEVIESDGEIKSSYIKEIVTTKVEPVLGQVVSEKMMSALEDTSEMPSAPSIEVPSTTGTPPTTPAPGLEDKEDSEKTDILVAEEAATGAAGTAEVKVTDSKKTDTATKKPLASTAMKSVVTESKAPSKPAAKPSAMKSTTSTTKPLNKAANPSTTTKPPAKAANAMVMTKSNIVSSAAKPASGNSMVKAGSVSSVAKPASATSGAKPTPKPSVGTVKATKDPVTAGGTKAPVATAAKPAVAAAKPAATAAKPVAAAAKPAAADAKPAVAAAKPAAAASKPAATAAKPTAAAAKPAVGAVKPAATSKPAATAKPAAAAKPVPSVSKAAPPKQLVLNKSTLATLKPPSKPTTPTTPKSPSAKSDVVKSPMKSMLAAKSSITVKSTAPDKKTVTNGDVKLITKVEVTDKKTTATKPITAKSTGAKPTSAAVNKPAVPTKTSSAVLPKAKPSATTASIKSAPAKTSSTGPSKAEPTATTTSVESAPAKTTSTEPSIAEPSATTMSVESAPAKTTSTEPSIAEPPATTTSVESAPAKTSSTEPSIAEPSATNTSVESAPAKTTSTEPSIAEPSATTTSVESAPAKTTFTGPSIAELPATTTSVESAPAKTTFTGPSIAEPPAKTTSVESATDKTNSTEQPKTEASATNTSVESAPAKTTFTEPSIAEPPATTTSVESATDKTNSTEQPKTEPSASTTSIKSAPAKTTSTVPSKAAPSAKATSVKSAPAPATAKKPNIAPATAGKTAVNKPGTNMKSAVNGKTAPSKTVIGAKKTDSKVNGKVSLQKSATMKQVGDKTKKNQENNALIQEDNVTTTNGQITNEQIQTIEIGELSQVAVDIVN